MWNGFSDFLSKASESLGLIGDDVGKNLEGITTSLPTFELPSFESSFEVPSLQEVKNEFSFSPVAELKVDFPNFPPLQDIQMPSLEQIKRTTEDARKALTTDLTQEWNSVVPSIEDIRKEAGGFSSDIGLAMELDFKGILGDTLEAKGEKQLFEALGTSFSLGKTPGEQLYTQNYAAGIELIRKYAGSLYQISYNNSRALEIAGRNETKVRDAILISYHQQHQWRLLKEKLEIVPRLIEDMEEVRGKLDHLGTKIQAVEELLNIESDLHQAETMQQTKAEKLREIALREAYSMAQVESLQEQLEAQRRKDAELQAAREWEERRKREEEAKTKQAFLTKKLEADFGRQMKDYEIYGMIKKKKKAQAVKLEDVRVEGLAEDDLDSFFYDAKPEFETTEEKKEEDEKPAFEYLEDEEPDFN